MKKILSAVCLLAAAGVYASAGTICPASDPTGANPLPYSPDNAATGCNVLITVTGGAGALTQTVVVNDPTPYENSEDVLVGVLNNSSVPVGSLSLTGTSIFGLDGDGICVYSFVGSGYCSASAMAGTDPQDYYGPTSTFNITNSDTGVVTFAPSIAAGASSYFSLEGVPTADNAVVVTPGTPGGAVPEPATLALFVPALAALALRRRLRA